MPRSYKEVNGDDSDTPTEILLNAEPGMTSSQRLHRHRKSSVGSEGSFSSLSDPEDMLRRRSRSVDTKGKGYFFLLICDTHLARPHETE